ncbi:MAG: dnaE [Dehalococcoidia bacterium]|nr:dnaE [Dehalococcoidia bacterium]
MRKAMGKKITEIMRAEREGFVSGAISKGFSPKVAEEVFDLIEPFAGYAFNRAHAVSYALIAYQTAYLKAHFTEEYMASLLTCFMDTPDKIAASVAECQRMGVPVLPPDVNRSSLDFTVEKQEDGVKAIRFGLTAIKNVGSSPKESSGTSRTSAGEST